MKKFLLLGCGNSRERKISPDGVCEFTGTLTTCDIDPAARADFTHDLNVFPYPFPDGEYDEVHVYEVLEHLGQQGDFRHWFGVFSELYRVLKPGGSIMLSVPDWQSEAAWIDPGHRWVMPPGMFVFLDQSKYREQVGKTSMTDYRWLWKGDLRVIYCQLHGHSHYIVLKKY